MSNYSITIDCPDCGVGEGIARDDFFGRHHFGYECLACNKVFDEFDTEMVLKPNIDASWRMGGQSNFQNRSSSDVGGDDDNG